MSPASSALRALTFDVTGTLIQPREPGRVYATVLARHGLAIEPSVAASALEQALEEQRLAAGGFEDPFTAHRLGARGWWSDVITRVCRLAEAPAPSRFATAELFDRFRDTDVWSMPPELPGLLGRLRAAGLRLGVIANWDERLDDVLTALGLAEHFDTVVRSSAVGVIKPHPAIFRRALEALEAEPQSTLHLGNDPLRDLEGAQAIGMLARRIDHPQHLVEVLEELLAAATPRAPRGDTIPE